MDGGEITSFASRGLLGFDLTYTRSGQAQTVKGVASAEVPMAA